VAYMAPADLRRLGIGAGDRMRVQTRRGSVELVARSDYAIPTGLIFMPFCYAEAAANVLTNPQLDPFGKIPEFKYCAVRIERGGRPMAAAGYGTGATGDNPPHPWTAST